LGRRSRGCGTQKRIGKEICNFVRINGVEIWWVQGKEIGVVFGVVDVLVVIPFQDKAVVL
jgi:hypothetical protein